MKTQDRIIYLKECISLDEGLIESYQRDVSSTLSNLITVLYNRIKNTRKEIEKLEKEIEREQIAKINL